MYCWDILRHIEPIMSNCSGIVFTGGFNKFWNVFQVFPRSVEFLPEASFGLRVLSSPASVCLCINHLLVHMITHLPLKLESPNLEHRCKRPWLNSVFFCFFFYLFIYLFFFWGGGGGIDLDLQDEIKLESRILPNIEHVRTIISHPLKLE